MDSIQEDQVQKYSLLRNRYERLQSTIETRGNQDNKEGSKPIEDDNASFNEPKIFPGLYAPSGFDMMGILIRVATRPNPKIDIGAVDSSCALLLCDGNDADTPIVYCSEAFEKLSGYSSDEILGLNCRFLQTRSGLRSNTQTIPSTDNDGVSVLRKQIEAQEEIQTYITNYTKEGRAFTNLLTVVPITWNTEGEQYLVGFQVDHGA